MFLLDIGNTNISIGYVVQNSIDEFLTLPIESFEVQFKNLLMEKSIKRVLVSSVVPKVAYKIRSICEEHNIIFYECGKEINIPVKNLYDNPQEVGQDRLLTVYAVNKLYANQDLRLVIDLGTALTFDFISVDGAYKGGLIFPGMRLALKSLLDNCALLPNDLELKPTGTLYGRSTIEGINNGIDFGYSFLIAGLINYLKKEDPHMKTLITGGGSKLLIEDICFIDYYDEKLALKGLLQLSLEFGI